MKVIVLAGGHGLRLWPLSTAAFPKQFLHFGDGESLLQKTLRRLLKRFDPEDFLISTHPNYIDLVRRQAQAVHPNLTEFLIEPMRKNTAPAILLAVKYLEENMGASKDDCFLVSSSDHLISPEEPFLDGLIDAEKGAKTGAHILFGISPTKPETGYGYIKIGKPLYPHLFQVDQFIEKPNVTLAQHYLLDGGYLWNAGIFLFQMSGFLDDLSHTNAALAPFTLLSLSDLLERFEELPDLSIDHALMEASKRVLVLPLSVSWSDIGSWDSVYEMLEKDQYQNVKIGNVFDIGSKNSLIVGGKRLIATMNLDELVIVETDEALFIGKRGESQKVKALVEELTKRKP